MKTGLVELVIIIDKSGSMNGLEKDVIGGFNSLIKEQSKHDGGVLVTILLFNNTLQYINQRVDIKTIKEMTDKDYIPNGCTALLDAIGSAISFVKTNHMAMKEEDIPEHTIFSIMTDGLENSSTEYSYNKIKNMIENQKKEGWEFLFQAANIDVIKEGSKLGISKEDLSSFDASGAGIKFCLASASANIFRKIQKPQRTRKR